MCREKNKKIIEFLLGYLVTVIIFILMLYDTLNSFLFTLLPDININYPTISSFFANFPIYNTNTLSTRQCQKIKMIENLPTEVSNLLKYSTNIKFSKSIDEVDTYITERISQAKDSVYDLNWQYYPKKNPNPRNQAKKDMLAIK